MAFANINDISMYYEIHGKGEALVLVSGFGADHQIWYPILDLLTEHYKIILFDNRGSGQTAVPKTNYSIPQMATDVKALCDYLEITKAHFIGSSMGGFIVQQIAYDYPDLVNKLVIANSVTKIGAAFQLYVDGQYELRNQDISLRSLFKAGMAWGYSDNFLADQNRINDLLNLMIKNPYPFTQIGYLGQAEALKTFDSSTWAHKIQSDTLVISGDQDIIFLEKEIKKLADAIPNASYYCFKDCAHLPFIEVPDEFCKIVRQFFQSKL